MSSVSKGDIRIGFSLLTGQLIILQGFEALSLATGGEAGSSTRNFLQPKPIPYPVGENSDPACENRQGFY